MSAYRLKIIELAKLWKWPLLALMVLLLGKVFDWFPALVEGAYYQFIYQIIRVIYDYTLGWVPFPMVYLLFCFIVYILYKFLSKLFKLRVERNYKTLLLSVVNFGSVVIICFYLFWGFNYHLPKVASRLEFSESILNVDLLYQETLLIDSLLTVHRQRAIGDTNVMITDTMIRPDLESILRNSQKDILSQWGYPTYGRVRIRKLNPPGILLRISTAGVYIPFVFEGHIDHGLHPIQWPFTMAHEMAHGYGITDEGECNFIGFVTCMNTDDEIIQYSAYLTYYRYLLNNLRLSDKEKYASIAKNMDPVVSKDINDIRRQLNKYPDILPELRDIIYDSYLKTHGIREGLASYSSIIRLIDQWKNSDREAQLVKRTFPWLKHE